MGKGIPALKWEMEKGKVRMKKAQMEQLEPVCALCEHMAAIEVTGDRICKYKNRMKRVQQDHSCGHFALDLTLYNPKFRLYAHADSELKSALIGAERLKS